MAPFSVEAKTSGMGAGRGIEVEVETRDVSREVGLEALVFRWVSTSRVGAKQGDCARPLRQLATLANASPWCALSRRDFSSEGPGEGAVTRGDIADGCSGPRRGF